MSNGRLVSLAVLVVCVAPVAAQRVTVDSNEKLAAAVQRKCKPGARIAIRPGEYSQPIKLVKVRGKPKRPITIEAADPKNPPRFTGDGPVIHLTSCEHVVLRNLHLSSIPKTAILIDDGGPGGDSSLGIRIESVAVFQHGPHGSSDALRLVGVEDFVVRQFHVSGWAGSAITMVGCQDGLIEDCSFVGKKGSQQRRGVQFRGGTQRVVLQTSFFKDCGERSVVIGGNTPPAEFRPELRTFEAKDVLVAGNRIVGSRAPVAWVTASGSRFEYNTIYCPAGKGDRAEAFVIRILQESKSRKFKACHGGFFAHNLVVFDQRMKSFVNVGSNTDAPSFQFLHNAWFEIGGKREPVLPAKEKRGVYGADPRMKEPGTATMIPGAKSKRFRGLGAHGYQKKVTGKQKKRSRR